MSKAGSGGTADQGGPRGSRWRVGVLGAYLVVVAVVWWVRTLSSVSDDSRFYLVIARNIVLHGEQTFSRVMSTNGAHPAWLYLLTAYTYVANLFGDAWQTWPTYAVPLAVALLAWGTFSAWRVARRLELEPLVVCGVPLAYLTIFGVLFSEAHLFYAALAQLLYTMIRAGREGAAWPAALGLAAALVFLARLDSLFFLVVVGVWVLPALGSVRRVGLAALAFGVPAGLYLVCNEVYFGGLMPMSGWMKSSFPHVFLRGFEANGPASGLGGYSIFFGILPWLGAVGYLARVRGEWTVGRRVLALLALGVGLHLIYIVLFTRSHTAWYWYYVLPVVMAGLGIGLAVRDLRRWPEAAPLLGCGLLGVALASMVGRSVIANTNRAFYTQALIAALRSDPEDCTVLISEYPGEVAYYTGKRVIAADMLTSNRRFYEAMRSAPDALGFLFDFCAAEGKPIKYVADVGNIWLTLDVDRAELVMSDPRSYPQRLDIGRRRLTGELVYRSRDQRIILWCMETGAGVDRSNAPASN